MTLEQPTPTTTGGSDVARRTPTPPTTTKPAQPTPRRGSAGSGPERRHRRPAQLTGSGAGPPATRAPASRLALAGLLLLGWAACCRCAPLAADRKQPAALGAASGDEPDAAAAEAMAMLLRELANRSSNQLELLEEEVATAKALLFVLQREQAPTRSLTNSPGNQATQQQRVKRSGISDQRLAEIQMIRALKKQLVERASKLASDASAQARADELAAAAAAAVAASGAPTSGAPATS